MKTQLLKSLIEESNFNQFWNDEYESDLSACEGDNRGIIQLVNGDYSELAIDLSVPGSLILASIFLADDAPLGFEFNKEKIIMELVLNRSISDWEGKVLRDAVEECNRLLDEGEDLAAALGNQIVSKSEDPIAHFYPVKLAMFLLTSINKEN